MTINQIKDFLSCSKDKVKKAIIESSKYKLSIKLKCSNNMINKDTNFTEEETRLIFNKLNASKIQQLLLEEHFESLKRNDYYTIKGTNDFINKWNNNKYIKCCNTCKYLCGDKTKTKQAIPYCKLYHCTLTKIKAKVYRDYCPDYIYNDLDKPIIWLTDKAPLNLNKFGEPITNSKANLPSIEELEKSDSPASLVGFF